MSNIEKVISGLKHCMDGPAGCQRECPYKCDFGCRSMLAKDAYAILKAQEPVSPKYVEFMDKGLTWESYKVPMCGICGTLLGDALFCPQCGRAVKW